MDKRIQTHLHTHVYIDIKEAQYRRKRDLVLERDSCARKPNESYFNLVLIGRARWQ